MYADQILPRAINFALRGGEFAGPRARTAAGLDGEVLEIGFGSGLNIPYYPAGLRRVQAVDPATAGRKLAAQRAAESAVPIEYVGSDAAALPIADASVDSVLSTWTLCTIPDAMQALAEVRRVLRPGGAFCFVEHGLAPDTTVARLQQWLTPLQRRAFGGCHLNRRIDELVAAAGLELTRMDTYYMKGPRALGYTFEGVAVRPLPAGPASTSEARMASTGFTRPSVLSTGLPSARAGSPPPAPRWPGQPVGKPGRNIIRHCLLYG